MTILHAKNRSGDSSGCGLQMRATQCSQLSWPLRISISTRKKIDRDFVFAQQARNSDSVFFGRDNHFQIAPDTAIDKTLQFRVGVAVMIDVALGQFDLRAELAQSVFETFRRSNAAKRTDKSVPQMFQRAMLAGDNILQMKAAYARTR